MCPDHHSPRSGEPFADVPHSPLEQDLDRLAHSVGAHAEGGIDLREEFLDWQAAELRARQRPSARLGERRLSEVVSRIRERMLGRSVGVECLDVLPDPEAPAAEETVLASAASEGAHRFAPHFEHGIAAGLGRALWDEPCDSWVRVPDDMPRGDYVALTVKGDSMLPLIHSDDVVLVKLGTDVARDTIVVARRPDDGYVVKRVGRVSPSTVELISLNPDYPPTTIERAEGAITGTVLLRWCGHK